ncbi:hypothetical protein [Nocardia sp. NPDC051463]|uniref:hypothetical protein n=1 Tax=Nocardia sp. NPDC051463 TaxID=3154845 RepID=UPI00344F3EE7
MSTSHLVDVASYDGHYEIELFRTEHHISIPGCRWAASRQILRGNAPTAPGDITSMTSNLRSASHSTSDGVPRPPLVESRRERGSMAAPIREYRLAAGTLPLVSAAPEQLGD